MEASTARKRLHRVWPRPTRSGRGVDHCLCGKDASSFLADYSTIRLFPKPQSNEQRFGARGNYDLCAGSATICRESTILVALANQSVGNLLGTNFKLFARGNYSVLFWRARSAPLLVDRNEGESPAFDRAWRSYLFDRLIYCRRQRHTRPIRQRDYRLPFLPRKFAIPDLSRFHQFDREIAM